MQDTKGRAGIATRRPDDRRRCQAGRLGLAPGERVGMLVGSRLEFIEFFLGAMRAGAIPVLLNARLAAATLADIFNDAGCAAAPIDPRCNPAAISVAESA